MRGTSRRRRRRTIPIATSASVSFKTTTISRWYLSLSLPLSPFPPLPADALSRQHLNSRVHRGRQIKCPFCSRLFTTAAGLAHHLESASCPNASGLGRDGLYRFVRSKDPQGLISKNLIEWTGSSHYEADSGAWNGNGYTCPLCHRQFVSLVGLNQHLNSPIRECSLSRAFCPLCLLLFACLHALSRLDQQDLYHCPNPACRADFKTLTSPASSTISRASPAASPSLSTSSKTSTTLSAAAAALHFSRKTTLPSCLDAYIHGHWPNGTSWPCSLAPRPHHASSSSQASQPEPPGYQHLMPLMGGCH